MTGGREVDPAGHGAGRVDPLGGGRSGTAPAEPESTEHGVHPETAPVGGGGARITAFTVLFDAGCPICRAGRRWLEGRAQLVPLEFVPAGSGAARERFPGLDHEATLRDITVVGDDGSVFVGDGAWVACLWALADYRGMAERISSPALLPSARKFIAAVSAIREATRSPVEGDAADAWTAAGGPPAAAVTAAGGPPAAVKAAEPPMGVTAGDALSGWAGDYGDGCDERCR
ncbi:hypothetical protein Ade02nite_62490 [Paractinoplanes deccanensis]|uniref:DUF393 domain-containing protein n=1 Tax=Paractinoplanes deccanensis TaxID=113561 RepID=A0ABQ3YC99_9ACTN|nr:DCC1-like thiol-disulfide oxidoreductase family protein [Actinoplanes deccanensis]GID77608.1 hypothetical protein Ade02nite_62490 [Actinoplanes deccanensis]